MGVDQETLITPIPTFPPQGGRRLRVRDPVAKGTSRACPGLLIRRAGEGEGFPPSPKGKLNRGLDRESVRCGSAFQVYSEEKDANGEAEGDLKYLSPS